MSLVEGSYADFILKPGFHLFFGTVLVVMKLFQITGLIVDIYDKRLV